MSKISAVLPVFMPAALAVVFGALLSVCGLGSVKAGAVDDLKEAIQCSFIIPPDFMPDEIETGLFINKQHPMESSTIKYGSYYNGKDKVLTNREKKELATSKEPNILDESANLTKEIFQNTMASAYDSEYHTNVDYKVTSFENINIDGYPGYRISANFRGSITGRTYQTVYILLSKYRTYTITYQRAEDDDCEELFAQSQASIHIR